MSRLSKNLTTFEQRKLVQAHNEIFLSTFFRSGLSLAFPVSKRNEWDRDYHLIQSATEADGI